MSEFQSPLIARTPRVTLDTLVGAGITAPRGQLAPRRILYPEFARWALALFTPEDHGITLSSAATRRLLWLLRHPVQHETGLMSRRRCAVKLVEWMDGEIEKIEQCRLIARKLSSIVANQRFISLSARWIERTQYRYSISDNEDMREDKSRYRARSFIKDIIYDSHGSSDDRKLATTFISALTVLSDLENLLTSHHPPTSEKLLHSLDRLRSLSRTPLHPRESGCFASAINFSNNGILDEAPPEVRWDISVASSLRARCADDALPSEVDAYVTCRCAILALILSIQGRLPAALGDAKNLIEYVGALSGDEVVTLLASPKPSSLSLGEMVANISDHFAPFELALHSACAISQQRARFVATTKGGNKIELAGLVAPASVYRRYDSETTKVSIRPITLNSHAPTVRIQKGRVLGTTTAIRATTWAVLVNSAGLPLPCSNGKFPLFRRIACIGPAVPTEPGFGSGAASARRMEGLLQELSEAGAPDADLPTFGSALGQPTATTPKVAKEILNATTNALPPRTIFLASHSLYPVTPTEEGSTRQGVELSLPKLEFPSTFARRLKIVLPRIHPHAMALVEDTRAQQSAHFQSAHSGWVFQHAMCTFPENTFVSPWTARFLSERLSGRFIFPEKLVGKPDMRPLPAVTFPFALHEGLGATEEGMSSWHLESFISPNRPSFSLVCDFLLGSSEGTPEKIRTLLNALLPIYPDVKTVLPPGGVSELREFQALRAALSGVSKQALFLSLTDELMSCSNSDKFRRLFHQVDLAIGLHAMRKRLGESHHTHEQVNSREGGWEFQSVRPLLIRERRGTWGVIRHGLLSDYGAPISLSLGGSAPLVNFLVGHHSAGKSTLFDSLVFSTLCEVNNLPQQSVVQHPHGARIAYLHRHAESQAKAHVGLTSLNRLGEALSQLKKGDLLVIDELPGVPPSWMTWLLPAVVHHCQANSVHALVVTHALTDDLALVLYRQGAGFLSIKGKGDEPRTVTRCTSESELLCAPFGERTKLE